jgi:hypothetical protein
MASLSAKEVPRGKGRFGRFIREGCALSLDATEDVVRR